MMNMIPRKFHKFAFCLTLVCTQQAHTHTVLYQTHTAPHHPTTNPIQPHPPPLFYDRLVQLYTGECISHFFYILHICNFVLFLMWVFFPANFRSIHRRLLLLHLLHYWTSNIMHARLLLILCLFFCSMMQQCRQFDVLRWYYAMNIANQFGESLENLLKAHHHLRTHS